MEFGMLPIPFPLLSSGKAEGSDLSRILSLEHSVKLITTYPENWKWEWNLEFPVKEYSRRLPSHSIRCIFRSSLIYRVEESFFLAWTDVE